MYDAIIVGARCAGSPTGMLLAQAGLKVLVVDRDTFPSDVLSTHFLQPDAMVRLEKWGIRQRLIDAGTPQATTMMLNALGASFPAPPGEFLPMAPRRTVLDTALVNAAREAGAEVREGFSVQEITRDASGAVTGIVGRDATGNAVTEQARVVIGADGRNSFVARQVNAEEYNAHEATSCGFYAYLKDTRTDIMEITLADEVFAFYFSTNGGGCVGIETAMSHWDEIRADPGGYVAGVLREKAPTIAAHIQGAEVDGRWLGMQGRRSFFRKPYGPGWALVGDAGYLKDPICGTGIDDALRDAELLSAALIAGFRGEKPLDEALAAYQEARDKSQSVRYPIICELAELGPMTPERLGKFAMQAVPVPA